MGLQRGEIFWLRLTTASAQCLRLSERFFIFPLVRVIFGVFTQLLQRQEGHLACKNGVGLLAKVISPELCMSKLYTTASIISCRGKIHDGSTFWYTGLFTFSWKVTVETSAVTCDKEIMFSLACDADAWITQKHATDFHKSQ